MARAKAAHRKKRRPVTRSVERAATCRGQIFVSSPRGKAPPRDKRPSVPSYARSGSSLSIGEAGDVGVEIVGDGFFRLDGFERPLLGLKCSRGVRNA